MLRSSAKSSQISVIISIIYQILVIQIWKTNLHAFQIYREVADVPKVHHRRDLQRSLKVMTQFDTAFMIFSLTFCPVTGNVLCCYFSMFQPYFIKCYSARRCPYTAMTMTPVWETRMKGYHTMKTVWWYFDIPGCDRRTDGQTSYRAFCMWNGLTNVNDVLLHAPYLWLVVSNSADKSLWRGKISAQRPVDDRQGVPGVHGCMTSFVFLLVLQLQQPRAAVHMWTL